MILAFQIKNVPHRQYWRKGQKMCKGRIRPLVLGHFARLQLTIASDLRCTLQPLSSYKDPLSTPFPEHCCQEPPVRYSPWVTSRKQLLLQMESRTFPGTGKWKEDIAVSAFSISSFWANKRSYDISDCWSQFSSLLLLCLVPWKQAGFWGKLD